MAHILALRRGLILQHEQGTTDPFKWGLIRSPILMRANVQTMGIVGIGRIGTAVALRAKAFVGFRQRPLFDDQTTLTFLTGLRRGLL